MSPKAFGSVGEKEFGSVSKGVFGIVRLSRDGQTSIHNEK